MEKGTKVRVKEIEDMPHLDRDVFGFDPRGMEGVVDYVFDKAIHDWVDEYAVLVNFDPEDKDTLKKMCFAEDELEVVE